MAESKDFDSLGALKRESGVMVLDEAAATGLRDRLEGRPFTVGTVETKPYTSKPKPPFITSTLQQVGGSRLRMSAQQVMRVAQGLYERGYITYMRTDSTTLSDTAVAAARQAIEAKLRPRVPHRRPTHLHEEGEERAGGPRGDPSGGRLVPQPRRAPTRAA